MKSILIFVLVLEAALCIGQTSDAIHYTSLNTAIYLGQYDGDQSANDLKKFGDFGVGSEERLASEMIMLDGKIYAIPSSGQATIMKPQAKIPFASVKFFKSEKSVALNKKLTLETLEQQLDSMVGKNRFAAIKITAKFSSIKFRSFYEQQKPYKELSQAKEAFFEHKNFHGILVGFRTPKSAEVLNSPAYHFHVIDQNKTTGGHLVECVIEEAIIEIDYASQLIVDLPGVDKLEHVDLNKKIEKE